MPLVMYLSSDDLPSAKYFTSLLLIDNNWKEGELVQAL